ncbi:hypothetical protein [Acidicapsa acidisoli]|nr:hypothetical protein [Acidicapsa acidisoli]
MTPTERPPVHLLRILPEEKIHIAPVAAPKQEPPETVPVTGSLFE